MFITVCLIPAGAQEFVWAGRGGGTNNFSNQLPQEFFQYEHIRDIVVDSQDNYYYLAIISGGATDLDGVPFTNYNGTQTRSDLLLFSTDCSGNLRWQKVIGNHSTLETQNLTIDDQDNVYLSGYIAPRFSPFNSGVHFDTDVVITSTLGINDPGPHNKSIFLIKYDAQGVFQWLQRPQEDMVALAGWQSTYAFGHYTQGDGTTHWLVTMGAGAHLDGAYTLTGQTYAILRFDPAGTFIDATPIDMVISGGFSSYSFNFTMDEMLDRYYLSYKRNTSSGTSMTFYGNQSDHGMGIVAIERGSGNLVWNQESTGSTNGSDIQELRVDDQSNLYVTGKSNQATSNGNVESFAGYVFDQVRPGLPGFLLTAPYLIKLDQDGALLWGTNPTRGTRARSYDIALYGNEVAIATGLEGAGDWGGVDFMRPPGSFSHEVVVMRFDTLTGNALSLSDVTGSTSGDEEATAIAVDSHGNYAVGGFFKNQVFLGHPNINTISNNTTGASDFWYGKLARTDCAGVPLHNKEAGTVLETSIYPNPATHGVNINGTVDFQGYTIHDTTGKQLRNGRLDRDRYVPLDGLHTGIYMLTLESDKGELVTVKLVKK
ncbi:MAG: T9SS type A sorting domain-containing protein [Nonlabens sp.]